MRKTNVSGTHISHKWVLSACSTTNAKLTSLVIWLDGALPDLGYGDIRGYSVYFADGMVSLWPDTDLQFSWERWQRADHCHLSRDHRMALV